MIEAPVDYKRLEARRRTFDDLEARLVRLAADLPARQVHEPLHKMRYAISLARLTHVRNLDGQDVDTTGLLHLHASQLRTQLLPRMRDAETFWDAVHDVEQISRDSRRTRESILQHLPIDRASLEREITTKKLIIASGGGGGAGYGYPGVYDMVDRIGLQPSLLVGTSIGALMSMFRARASHFDLSSLLAAARALSWSKVFRMLQAESRYGLPATLRLFLRNALGSLFIEDGRQLRLNETAIPLYVVASGLTVDALKHDLNYYEHFADDMLGRRGKFAMARNIMKATAIIREFLTRPETLRRVVLGRAEGTESFDVLDAAGFSAAIPGVIHYDVIRDDPRMTALLDRLYASYGITRLGEGGLTSNVPAKVGWESAVSGELDGHRNAFVLALDCFAPSRSRIAWLPFQQAVRQANVAYDMKYADLYLPLTKTLSPLNLVPQVEQCMQAIRWGRAAIKPHLDFLQVMMEPIDVLRDHNP